MRDQHDNPFVAQFKIPAWCPPNISIGMKNGKKVSYIGDPLNLDVIPLIWRDIDEDLRLEWAKETLGQSPSSFSFDYILRPEMQRIMEESNGERYLEQYSTVGSHTGPTRWGPLCVKEIAPDYFAPLPPNSYGFIKWIDLTIIAEQTCDPLVNVSGFVTSTQNWDGTYSGDPVCGIVLINGNIFFYQDVGGVLDGTHPWSDVLPYSVGTYNVGERILFVEIIDTTIGQSQIWKNGQVLDGGTYHPFMAHSLVPNCIAFETVGTPTISKVYSTGVAKFSVTATFWEDFIGYQWRYCGIEGSIAKILAPFALEMDYAKTQVNLLHQAIFVENFIKDLLDTQLYTASPNLSGISLLGEEDKHILIEILNQCIHPTAEKVIEIVKMFAGSTPSSLIYENDIKPNLWSVRFPKPLASDAIWQFAQTANYSWLLNKMKAISTNVFLEWYYNLIEPETWSPSSLTRMVFNPIGKFRIYRWSAFWDSQLDHWDDGAWDAPKDWVTIHTFVPPEPPEIISDILDNGDNCGYWMDMWPGWCLTSPEGSHAYIKFSESSPDGDIYKLYLYFMIPVPGVSTLDIYVTDSIGGLLGDKIGTITTSGSYGWGYVTLSEYSQFIAVEYVSGVIAAILGGTSVGCDPDYLPYIEESYS